MSGLIDKFLAIFERSGFFLFMREAMQNPANIGAVLPSSKVLAAQVADQVSHAPPGFIVELGAGTGIITDALLKQGIPSQQIIVIERVEKLATHLQQRYPTLRVIQGDASRLSELLGEDAKKVSTIVSSLPLRSLPPKTVIAIRDQFKQILKPKSKLIQFTYSFRKHDPVLSSGFRRIYSKRVWINIPPARIDIFEREI